MLKGFLSGTEQMSTPPRSCEVSENVWLNCVMNMYWKTLAENSCSKPLSENCLETCVRAPALLLAGSLLVIVVVPKMYG